MHCQAHAFISFIIFLPNLFNENKAAIYLVNLRILLLILSTFLVDK